MHIVPLLAFLGGTLMMDASGSIWVGSMFSADAMVCFLFPLIKLDMPNKPTE